MEWVYFAILTGIISYLVIQVAIDKSKITELLKENNKLLMEVKELIKKQNEMPGDGNTRHP